MSDAAKYPLTNCKEHPPTCRECGARMVRLRGVWFCADVLCDADWESDAELENRLQSEAEAAHERVYCR